LKHEPVSRAAVSDQRGRGRRSFPPDVGAEVAFVGRSNSGKSSAINAIAQRRGLARTSKTPGRTRLLNFFELAPLKRLVDLAGLRLREAPRKSSGARGRRSSTRCGRAPRSRGCS